VASTILVLNERGTGVGRIKPPSGSASFTGRSRESGSAVRPTAPQPALGQKKLNDE